MATSYFNIGECYQNMESYEQAIIAFREGYSIDKKGGYPFRIAVCLEKLQNLGDALAHYIQSAVIRKDHPEVGLEAKATQESISNAKRLAKELNKEIDQLDFELRNAVTGNAIDVQYLNHLNESFNSYNWTDINKARKLINEGIQQVNNGKTSGVRNIIIQLIGLMPEDEKPETLG